VFLSSIVTVTLLVGWWISNLAVTSAAWRSNLSVLGGVQRSLGFAS
jgi:hypothetical protein